MICYEWIGCSSFTRNTNFYRFFVVKVRPHRKWNQSFSEQFSVNRVFRIIHSHVNLQQIFDFICRWTESSITKSSHTSTQSSFFINSNKAFPLPQLSQSLAFLIILSRFRKVDTGMWCFLAAPFIDESTEIS